MFTEKAGRYPIMYSCKIRLSQRSCGCSSNGMEWSQCSRSPRCTPLILTCSNIQSLRLEVEFPISSQCFKLTSSRRYVVTAFNA